MDKHFANDFIRLEKRRKLRREIFNSIRKLDVIQELLDDDEVTEIMVNGPDEIFIEKEGRIFKSPLQFENQERLDNIAQQIASAGNRIVNETNPILDARLEDGSRVNIVVPPIAIEGPVITIRKFPKEIMTMEKLVQLGSITREAEVFLRKMVQAKYNIFISGGTGAGKTTFLNVLSGFIPRWERVVTIEDSAELQIQNIDNLVRLESRNANVEGKNQITIRDLVKSALRMRPDGRKMKKGKSKHNFKGLPVPNALLQYFSRYFILFFCRERIESLQYSIDFFPFCVLVFLFHSQASVLR